MKESEKPRRRRLLSLCDEEIALDPFPYCRPCQVELRYCFKCSIVVERKAKFCPECGQPLE